MSTDNSEQQDWLEEAQARCDRAADGPWSHQPGGKVRRKGRVLGQFTHPEKGTFWTNMEDLDNAEFTAHARTDLPRALALIRDLTGKLQEARAALRDVATAALRYDAAIFKEAGSTAAQDKWAESGHTNPVLVGSYDLDDLYFYWLEKSRRALAALDNSADASKGKGDKGVQE